MNITVNKTLVERALDEIKKATKADRMSVIRLTIFPRSLVISKRGRVGMDVRVPCNTEEEVVAYSTLGHLRWFVKHTGDEPLILGNEDGPVFPFCRGTGGEFERNIDTACEAQLILKTTLFIDLLFRVKEAYKLSRMFTSRAYSERTEKLYLCENGVVVLKNERFEAMIIPEDIESTAPCKKMRQLPLYCLLALSKISLYDYQIEVRWKQECIEINSAWLSVFDTTPSTELEVEEWLSAEKRYFAIDKEELVELLKKVKRRGEYKLSVTYGEDGIVLKGGTECLISSAYVGDELKTEFIILDVFLDLCESIEGGVVNIYFDAQRSICSLQPSDDRVIYSFYTYA